jgi:hypothetical protein
MAAARSFAKNRNSHEQSSEKLPSSIGTERVIRWSGIGGPIERSIANWHDPKRVVMGHNATRTM